MTSLRWVEVGAISDQIRDTKRHRIQAATRVMYVDFLDDDWDDERALPLTGVAATVEDVEIG